jgi:hypothetical protein
MGPLPQYFPLWIRSCKYNPEVNFLVFGSHLPEKSPIENVKFINTSLDEFEKRASKSAQTQARVGSPTKICDFKPDFGHIFREYIDPFDFWGYCDIDVVWGDLSPLLRDEILEGIDIVSVRGDRFLSGPCTFYRNTSTLRKLYKRSPTWEEVFTDPNHWAFDEDFGRGGARPIREIRHHDDPVSMVDITMHEVDKGRIDFYTPEPPYVIHEPTPTSSCTFEWSKGALTKEGSEEALAYHFLFTKNAPFFRIPEWAEVPDPFVIDSCGVHSPSTNMLSYEVKRLGGGAFRWAKQTITQKVRNARVKIRNRLLG